MPWLFCCTGFDGYVILVQFRSYPVPVGNDSLLAIVADDQRRYAVKISQSIVVDSDLLRLLS